METSRQSCVTRLQKLVKEQEERIREQEEQIKELRYLLSSKQETQDKNSSQKDSPNCDNVTGGSATGELSKEHIERYSRQLLLSDGFGVEGQRKLLNSSVLVIGAGGIGSTVLLYLASSGVGKISVVDFDTVDRSNLHRQVIHKDANVGMNKAVSACCAMKDLNPSITCVPITEAFTPENALAVVESHDCVVDASDNPLTRYLINDACVLAGRPLVSGSAIGMEGQLSVYNHAGGPCYRCLYPKPNQTEGCKSCSDSGVLGPVPGLIGILQSVEVLKVLTDVGTSMKDRLLMYDSLRCSFMNIKKPPKSPTCPLCGEKPTIVSMEESRSVSQCARGPTGIESNSGDTSLSVQPRLSAYRNVSCAEYADVRKKGEPHVLLDVRVKRQFDMCSLDGAVHIPLASLPDDLDRVEELCDGVRPVYCLCRRGISSVEATRILSEAVKSHPKILTPTNISGGLQAWSDEVDASFPKY